MSLHLLSICTIRRRTQPTYNLFIWKVLLQTYKLLIKDLEKLCNLNILEYLTISGLILVYLYFKVTSYFVSSAKLEFVILEQVDIIEYATF
jgi:hypothetical protein